jgi:hypothetical protein
MLSQWLEAAEKEAGFPKLAGDVWHPYRRKWTSERSHFPIKAVAEAGVWKDATTLIRSYQHTDEETLLAVMEGQEKKTDTTPASAQSLGVLRLVR